MEARAAALARVVRFVTRAWSGRPCRFTAPSGCGGRRTIASHAPRVGRRAVVGTSHSYGVRRSSAAMRERLARRLRGATTREHRYGALLFAGVASSVYDVDHSSHGFSGDSHAVSPRHRREAEGARSGFAGRPVGVESRVESRLEPTRVREPPRACDEAQANAGELETLETGRSLRRSLQGGGASGGPASA